MNKKIRYHAKRHPKQGESQNKEHRIRKENKSARHKSEPKKEKKYNIHRILKIYNKKSIIKEGEISSLLLRYYNQSLHTGVIFTRR